MLLEEALAEQKGLINKGYSEQQIQTAALIIIAERLTILTTPIVVMEGVEDGAD